MKTTLLTVALLLAAAACFAGVNKTGGVYEVTADAITAGGFSEGTGALFTIYNAFGQQTGYYTEGSGGNFTVIGGILGAIEVEAPDTTPPDAVAAVNDGTGTDIDYATSTTQLSANWSAATDIESGISGYWIAIGTTAGATDTLGWMSAGAVTATTVAGLTLTDGTTYYFSVKAENGVGLESTATTSDGVTIATTMPTSAVSSPANGASLNAVASISGTAADGAGTGLSLVEISISRSSDSNYWDGSTWTASETWLSVSGTSTWTYSSGLPTWQDGEIYTIQSRATDNAGNVEVPGAGNTFTFDAAAVVSITSPVDGALISNAQVTVSGTTETGATVTVNDVAATVSGTTFTVVITLSSQGTNTITASATDAAGNTASDSVSVTLDSQAPTAQITAPTGTGTVSGTVTVSGSATDDNFSSLTVEYGPGASPTLWKTIATSTKQQTSATLGAADMSLLSGIYTFRLTAADSFGNTTQDTVTVTVSGNTLTNDVTVVEDWQLISVSMDMTTADQEEILSNENMRIYRWDPNAELLDDAGKYRTPTSLPAGMGLWVSVKYTGVEVDVTFDGSPVDTTRDYSYALGTGWNQIGPPFPWQVSWANVSVSNSGETYDLTTAASLGIVESTPFYFDGEGWRQLTEMTTPAMQPGTGYFIYAPGSGVSLVYDPGAEDSSGVARIVKRNRDFSMKISASSSGAADLDNIIALSGDFEDGHDGLDLREPPGALGEYVSLYFPHDNWGLAAGKYTNDFRNTTGVEDGCDAGPGIVTCKVWDFTVETGTPGKVTLKWDSIEAYADRFDLTLEDISAGKSTDMAAGTSYSFQSPGSAGKSFRITLKGRPPALRTLSYSLRNGWNLVSIPLELVETDASVQLGDDMPDNWVYQYFDGTLYSVKDDEGVDIESGVGYWVFADGDTQIDLEGYDVNEALPPSVPLKKGWNFIGNPYTDSLDWGDNITVTCGASEMTLGTAAADGWVSSTVYSYAGDGKYSAVQPGGTLAPWAGYLMQASGDCWIELKK